LTHLKTKSPDIQNLPDPPNSTAQHYQIPGYRGNIGIIAAYSRTFCGSCNRIRITPKGMLKTFEAEKKRNFGLPITESMASIGG